MVGEGEGKAHARVPEKKPKPAISLARDHVELKCSEAFRGQRLPPWGGVGIKFQLVLVHVHSSHDAQTGPSTPGPWGAKPASKEKVEVEHDS